MLLIIGFFAFNDFSESTIQITYKEQIPGSTITHSGETIEEVLGNKESLSDNEKALLQEYLEKYSSLLKNQLVENTDIEEDYTNIIEHYPVENREPAWVDLFREGRFQLYYNSDLIRVFVQGSNPKEDFEKHKSIIRFPIRSVINSDDTEIKEIEVYSFENDYASQKLTLYEKPHSISINDLDLKNNKQSIDLTSIQNMFNQKVNLEALEITNDDELYFYGKLDETATLANEIISLSDIAVVYRALFHHGYNSPYISLDKHEINKYAKVNFGGYLDNTRAGYVLLEADKFFKTLSVGLDPNTYELVADDMKEDIPGFLTEDERTLLNESGKSISKNDQISFLFDSYTNNDIKRIRYWFYPEEITTITDGNIGVIKNNQFLAGSERMDEEDITLDKSTKDTIAHLNNNYHYYESHSKRMKELSNLGKILGLINWLKEERIDNRVDLDQFLSVELPSLKTDNKTDKLLAATALIYPSGKVTLNENNINEYTHVMNKSNLFKESSLNKSDQYYIDQISENIDEEELYGYYEPYKELNEEIKTLENDIDELDEKIETLYEEINSYIPVNRYDSEEVDKYNNLVNKYNNLTKRYEESVNEYNDKIDRMNNMALKQKVIVSISGGISLNPTEFKSPIYNENALEVNTIKNIKTSFEDNGQFLEYNNWVKSDYKDSEVYYNELPAIN
ncbi:hypothetical protein [Halanaerobium hydrogeniformans]|uniref:Uncharacterized protein n=1 Tax=Halanaerobium hydrogeniformans TaxID=656519 RepID=E4RMF5_HALHG|nr:hypothetical protein [Halanaerobium hydrogeniformans]ADQ14486.1 hypothetical protein Halsa_1047 [Halanaerobium hydrogeniformans]